MTFDPNVPNAIQSPGLFPAQMNTDLARLKAIISGDHQFNDTVPVPNTDGFHKEVSYINKGTVPAVPAGANAIGFSRLLDLGTGVNRTETFNRNSQSSMLNGARAYGVFTGLLVNGAATIHSSFNVTSITRTGTGLYTVVMTNALATAQYAVVFGSSASGHYPVVSSAAPTTTTFQIQIYTTGTGTLTDPQAPFRIHFLVFGG